MNAPPTAIHRSPRSRALALLRGTLCAGFLAALWIPLVQQHTGILPELPLHGAEHRTPPLKLTPTTWRDGSYAQAFEAYYGQTFGWRAMLVRFANQLRYEAFGQAPRSAGTPVTIGKHGWLFENAYVHDYLGNTRPVPAGVAQDLADRLARLHAALRRRGIGLAVVVSPSKPTVYPEYLPDNLRRPTAPGHPRPYEAVMPALHAAGLPLVDAQQLFLQWKQRRPEALFAPTGTHWNFLGAVLTLEPILDLWRAQLGAWVPTPVLEGVVFGPPRGADHDLARLLNLFRFGGPETQRVPFPRMRMDASRDVRPLRVGVVGDSFAFTLIDGLALAGAAREVSLLYYVRREYRYGGPEGLSLGLQDHAAHAGDPIDPEVFDWGAWLLAHDAILLESNAILLLEAFWSFPERALRAVADWKE